MNSPDPSIGSNDLLDAGSGGAGAPPETTQSNKAPSDLTRTYEGDGIRVQWFASRCIHSAACVMALARVFDPQRRPWIKLEAAEADEIARAVERCPTGALHYVRTDGGPQETPAEGVTISAIRNGPYFVKGRVVVRDDAGHVIREDTRVALCRCGQSKHLPFCDNTHREIGFRAPPVSPMK